MAHYEEDVIEWAEEQATLLRARRFAELDTEWIIRIIESKGQQQVADLYGQLLIVLRHVLTWKYSPEERTRKLRSLIAGRRRQLHAQLSRTPSLGRWVSDDKFWREIWVDSFLNRKDIPGELRYAPPLWALRTVIDQAFFPD